MPPTEAIEAAFLAYRCNRDPAALAAVYDGTVSRLLAIATHLSGDTAMAEDAVQDTFLFALENPDRWDPSQPLVPWLLSILGFRLKKARNRANRPLDTARVPAFENAISEPGEEVMADEEFARIERAITHLAQPYQTVVLLRLRNGLRPVDIAVALNRKPSTIRAQLARGLEMLRKVLPVATMAMLSGSLSAVTGAPSTRETLLARATELHRGIQLERRVIGLRRWAISLTGCIAVVLAWTIWQGNPPLRPNDPTPVIKNVHAATAADVENHKLPRVPPGDEPDRQAPESTGSLRVMVTRAGERLPFANVELEPLADPPRFFVHHHVIAGERWREIASTRHTAADERRHGSTTADGAVTFSNLTAGAWICRALDVVEVVTIRAGQNARLRLSTDPRSVIVRGLVIDREGKPVPDAQVWHVDEVRKTHAQTLAYTDSEGRFASAVRPFTTIGVACAGHTSVAKTLTPKNARRTANVVLQLAGAGATLVGRVVDSSGDPVGGADVEVGHPNDARILGSADHQHELARRKRTTTDASGRFAFDSLAPGETIVVAHRRGFGAHRRVIALARHNKSTIELTLPEPAVIEGVARDPDGNPVAGAHVMVGRQGNLGFCSCTTTDDGRYRLSSLTPGRPTVEIADYRGGFAYRTIPCRAGEALTWNPILAPDKLRLSGRVVDAQGRAFVNGWIVHHAHWQVRTLPLDADGRFDVTLSERIAALPSSIRVYAEDPRVDGNRIASTPLAVARELRAGTSNLLITVPDQVAADCKLRGQLLPRTRALATGRLTLVGKANGQVWRSPVTDRQAGGAFQAERLLPGEYVLHVGATQRSYGPFTLSPGSDLDLGQIKVPPSAVDQHQIPVHLALIFGHDITATERIRLEVRDQHGWVQTTRSLGASIAGKDLAVRLPAGVFELTVISGSGLVAERQIVVDPRQPHLRALPVVFEQREPESQRPRTQR